MLQNAYFLPKIGFDTAENEPTKICKILQQNHYMQNLLILHTPYHRQVKAPFHFLDIREYAERAVASPTSARPKLLSLVAPGGGEMDAALAPLLDSALAQMPNDVPRTPVLPSYLQSAQSPDQIPRLEIVTQIVNISHLGLPGTVGP